MSSPIPNLTTAPLDFGGALQLLRQGRLVRRDGWPAHQPAYLYLSQSTGKAHISAARAGPIVHVWMPAPDDLVATDWRLCAPSERG